MSTDNIIIDYNKELNSKCYCGIGLPWIKEHVVMLYPCEHMFHSSCINKLKSKKCKICHTEYTKKITLLDKNIHPQHFADLLSITNYDDMCSNTTINFLDSIFDIITFGLKVPFCKTKYDCKLLCENLFTLNNLTLKVYGMDKLKLEKQKVLICNHVTYFEFIIIFYLFNPGFLSSNISKQSNIINNVDKIIDFLYFDRGAKRKYNIIDKMREFVEEKGSLCLFPEGFMGHPDTLKKFRSGAFHIGKPIYAIVIRHNNILSDAKVNNLFFKLCSKKNINMEVHILGPYYPPFSKEDIENIRKEMALKGNMLLSRVSNRDIKDDKNNERQI
jgi:hypothetical protein